MGKITRREWIYNRLQKTLDNVDLSDSIASEIYRFPDRSIYCIILTIEGYSQEKIGYKIGCSHQYVSKSIQKVKEWLQNDRLDVLIW